MGNKMCGSKQRGTSKRRRGVEIDRASGGTSKQPAFFVHVRKAGKNERGLMTTWKEGRRYGMCSSQRDTAHYFRKSKPERREEKKGLLRRMRCCSNRQRTSSKRELNAGPVDPV